MKNKQICPWCGEGIKVEKLKRKLTYHKHFSKKKYIILNECNVCKNTIYDKSNNISHITFLMSEILYMLYLLIAVIYVMECRIDDTNALNVKILLFPLVAMVIICLGIGFYFYYTKRHQQRYIPCDKNDMLISHKPIFSAVLFFSPYIHPKHIKKEFVKDNILQICANGEKEYIILTKAEFETGRCEATFPAKKKENGLKLLEKHSEFELSNGEEIIGKLKVEKIFEM